MSDGIERGPTATNPAPETVAGIGQVSLAVGVFCSANEVAGRYADPARQLMRLLAQSGHSLVWGGSNVGLMKTVAETAQGAGSKIVGVITESSYEKYARRSADEMIRVENLAERKKKLLEQSDVLVVLVGGTGTLDEITEVVEYKKYGKHNKPVVVLNTAGFYDGYRIQMQRMNDEEMLALPLERLVYFAQTPEEAIAHINEFAVSGAEAPTEQDSAQA